MKKDENVVKKKDPSILRTIVADLQKRLGTKASVGVMGDNTFASEPEFFIPSSSTLLNRAIGGGAAVGRVMEIFGDVQTGKTLLALDFIANMQKIGGLVYYLDAEFGTSKDFAKRVCGVDDNELGHLEVKYQEALWQSIEFILSSTRNEDEKSPICIVADSVAALAAKATKELSFEEQAQIGHEARIIRGALRRLAGEIAVSQAALILTNHEIAKINALPFGEKTQSWGGNAIKYFTSTRLKTIITGYDKRDGDIWAANCKVVVKKNRFDPPGRVVEYPIMVRGEHLGIDDHSSLVEFLWSHGALGSSKGFVEFAGVKSRKKEFIEQSRGTPDLYESIKTKALEIYDTRGKFEDED